MRYWFEEVREFVVCVILPTIAVFALIGALLVPGIGYMQSRSIKYNCHLDKAPSLHLSWMIDTDVYAYAPEKFCADVRNRMAKGE